MKSITFKIKGMHCVSCALNIDGELEDMKGIEKARTNYAQQKTEVTFDEMLVSEEKITSTIKTLGYDCNC